MLLIKIDNEWYEAADYYLYFDSNAVAPIDDESISEKQIIANESEIVIELLNYLPEGAEVNFDEIFTYLKSIAQEWATVEY